LVLLECSPGRSTLQVAEELPQLIATSLFSTSALKQWQPNLVY